MPRVKRSVVSRKRRKKVLEAAKGFVGTRHSRYKVANEAV
jgi:large subunit ribosomal protein L20